MSFCAECAEVHQLPSVSRAVPSCLYCFLVGVGRFADRGVLLKDGVDSFLHFDCHILLRHVDDDSKVKQDTFQYMTTV